VFVGILIICIGTFFLLRNFGVIPFWVGWEEFWPVLLIAVGLSMVADVLVKKSRKKAS